MTEANNTQHKCSHPDCDLEPYQQHNKCILHCKKDTLVDSELFYQTLLAYISNYKLANPKLKEKLFPEKQNISLPKINIQKNDPDDMMVPILKNVIFPMDEIHLKRLINELKLAIYEGCTFNDSVLIKHSGSNFEYCTFTKEVIYSDQEKEGRGVCKFHHCTFKDYCVVLDMDYRVETIFHGGCLQSLIFENIKINAHFASNINIKKITFNNCSFDVDLGINLSQCKELTEINISRCVINSYFDLAYLKNKIEKISFSNMDLANNLFMTLEARSVTLKDCNIDTSIERLFLNEKFIVHDIDIDNCVFTNKFKIIKRNINQLTIRDSTFNKELTIFDSSINALEIHGSTFNFDFMLLSSRFNNFLIERCSFKRDAIFTLSKFGEKLPNDNTEPQISTFALVTFENCIDMKDTEFNAGLDFSRINCKSQPNFLGSKINQNGTPRETYRIIKHSFDAVGNYTEGNKFFREEMRVYKEELHKDGLTSKKIAMLINHLTSDFGQNYVRPIILILFTMLIHSLLYFGYTNNFWIPKPEWLWKGLNYGVSTTLGILPYFKPERGNEGFATVAFLLYITYTVLIYQLVVALKRLTRR